MLFFQHFLQEGVKNGCHFDNKAETNCLFGIFVKTRTPILVNRRAEKAGNKKNWMKK